MRIPHATLTIACGIALYSDTAMEYLVVPLVALVASGLTLISGFGLGTLLMPAFAAFFPLERAIALTAIVHFANNLFKLALVGRGGNREIVLRFGIPAIVASIAGALILDGIGELQPIGHYFALGRERPLQIVNLAVAGLMVIFAVVELSPRFQKLELPPRALPYGGALSGFLGGLTGHQGALRSPFLLRYKSLLEPRSFIATNVVISCLVDAARLPIYGLKFGASEFDHGQWKLMAVAALAAFAGAVLGARFVKKVTLGAIQKIVAFALLVIAVLIGGGFVGH